MRTLQCLAIAAFLAALPSAPAQTNARIPEALRSWEAWALWGQENRLCPTPYNDPAKHICFWPSRLELQIAGDSGRFVLDVSVFTPTWVPLPGGRDAWPQVVKVGGAWVPVMDREGVPSVKLLPGTTRIEGSFVWPEIPRRIQIPPEIGVLTLTIAGEPVESPTWDAKGQLWLKSDGSSGEADKDFLAVQLFSVLEDGIPLWLRTEVELVVAGKSREEEIGAVLPAGWKLAAVESPIPVAVDEEGRLKAQVRAGKWTVRLDAFRIDDMKEFSYAANAAPPVPDQLVALQARPDFRTVEVVGSPSVDVSLTTFPERWRGLPVFRWETTSPFRIEERMRGMGMQRAGGLSITRQWWLDENGQGLTFRDNVSGTMQQIWRLDAAPGQDLGSVRSGGQGQLITRNPTDGAPGVEIRSRSFELEATGRMANEGALSATGWRADAEALRVTLNLPPGWRLFALFGADWVKGDWLTAWTLLDLFLLLIFTLAVFRLWGFAPAALAFAAFALSYHEPGAPRFVWLLLLLPLALLRVVPTGWGHRLAQIWKWAMVLVLVVVLVPFVTNQVQQALYPQLEKTGGPVPLSAVAAPASAVMEAAGEVVADSSGLGYSKRMRSGGKPGAPQQRETQNLLQDSKAKIQTGPGVPDWTWRTVSFGWNGPVADSQVVRPLLIPLWLERFLTIARILAVLGLAAVLLKGRRLPKVPPPLAAAVVAMFLLSPARAEFPPQELLDTLRDRLLEPSDAFPEAATIPMVALTLEDRSLIMDCEIHVAARSAVPLPGRLPSWSPLQVTVADKPVEALRRDDGSLWVVLPEGVHRVRVEGLLPEATEWEWAFQLRPRRVTVNAPGWIVSGVKPDGTPEAQIFFAREQKSEGAQTTYERQELQSVAQVERNIELGLRWQVRTTVRRLSPPGKAISLRIPLLAGENVLSSNAPLRGGFIEVRLGAQQPSFSWESELTPVPTLALITRAEDPWVERWQLVASPVWNVTLSGLPPVFEPSNPELVPVWHPWPGENVDLAISRPEAVPGATVTVQRATHDVALGKRQRTSTLSLSVQASLGEDFLVGLPEAAEVTSLSRDGAPIPVREDAGRIIVPLVPGLQEISLAWKSDVPLHAKATADEVRLPTESANVRITLGVPESRWILWTDGPLRGPAVRFWTVLICSLLAAWALGRVKETPLKSHEWMLLALGLTQVPLPAALCVVFWLFALSLRGKEAVDGFQTWTFNLFQLVLIALTVIALGVFIAVVAEGLLGNPEMFIAGNGSNRTMLNWYQARSGELLPTPSCVTISIWWYRLLMLAWALWLAASLLRWLRWGWGQFSTGGWFRVVTKKTPSAPPPIPR